MSNLTFAREPFTDALFAEMLPLLQRHKDEVAHYADIPLHVDTSVYHAAEANGALRIYTVREPTMRVGLHQYTTYLGQPCEVVEVRDGYVLFKVEGEGFTRSVRLDEVGPGPWLLSSRLVGYAVYFVKANPHYASSVQAVQDVIYVAPECRGSTGAKLIRYADEQLAAEGVQAVYHHVKTAHNWGKLLERMGYVAVDVIWAKRLDQPAFVGEDGG